MAAHSNFIRVRLYFDYPPPAVVDCRMCWLLVDLNKCRVVADLESIIREKFELSRRSILSLFIEDCYLPHTESVYVVRDNDSVRVKVDYLARVNGHISDPDTTGENCRKRQRSSEEAGLGENALSVEWKKQKRKKRCKASQERDAKQASGDESNKKAQGKHPEKKKRKRAEENGPTVTPKAAATTKKISVSVEQPVKTTKKTPVVQAKTQKVSSDSSSSSSSEEDEAPKKTAAHKPAPKIPSSTSAAPKVPPPSKPNQTKPRPPSSSSSETDSSSDEAPTVKMPLKNKPLISTTAKAKISDNSKSQQTPPALQSTNCAREQAAPTVLPPQDKGAEPGKSDSEEEIELVIRRPLPPWQGRGAADPTPWRGRGRGKNSRGGSGDWRRGKGRGGIRENCGSFEFNHNGAKELSYQTDSLTNTSVVLQNGAQSAPKPDYSSMPLLAAPPQVGQKIAFKLLELTENYTPEVSEYKEGKIVSYDLATKQIELELHNVSQAPAEPGKFDLIYQNPDGSERVEYAVSRSSRVTERWESLLEPRLII